MSATLMGELEACDTKLTELAEAVQEKVNMKANTNGAYAGLIVKARFRVYL